jgi:hypothetical protein
MMAQKQNSADVGMSKNTGQLRLWSFVVIAVAVALTVSAILLLGNSNKGNGFAVTGGSPYPLAELVANPVPRTVPASAHSVVDRAINNIPGHDRLMTALSSQGVSVGVDGVTIGNGDIVNKETVCLQDQIRVVAGNAYAQNLDPTTAISELESSGYCLHQAIALEVFDQVAAQATISSGHGVTIAQATQYAQEQLAQLQSAQGTPNALVLPPGETLQSITTCDLCIVGYQKDLNVQYEITNITGTLALGTTQKTELLNWFKSTLQSTSSLTMVNVPGVSASDLPSYLPYAASLPG